MTRGGVQDAAVQTLKGNNNNTNLEISPLMRIPKWLIDPDHTCPSNPQHHPTRECIWFCQHYELYSLESSRLPWVPLLDSLTGLAHVSMAALPPLAMWTARDPEAGVLGRELS